MKHINNFINKYKAASGVSAFMWIFVFAGPLLTEASNILVYTSVVLSGLSIYTLAFIGYTAVLGTLNPQPEVQNKQTKTKQKTNNGK